MPESKKRKLKINSADLIIFIAFLAVICGIFFRTPLENLIDEKFHSANISYQAVIYEKDSNFLEYINVGDTLYDENGINMGTVNDIRHEKSYTTGNGKAIVEYFDIFLTVEAQGRTDSLGNYIGESLFIAPGKELNLFTSDNATFHCTVKKVQTDK